MRTKKNPNSLANLKPFKAGAEWKGNAGGRPKRKPLTEALETIYANPKEAMAAAKAMARKIRTGDIRAFAEVADRIEGKVTDRQESVRPTVRVIVLDVPRPPNRLRKTDLDVQPTKGGNGHSS